jgi:hypothetical protein
MTGRHAKPRRGLRLAVTIAAAGAATAGLLTAVAAPSSADPFSTSCRARGIAFDGPKPLIIGAANNQLTPCASDYSAITDTSVPLVGINPLVTVGVHAVNEGTLSTQSGGGDFPLVTTSSATSDIARVTIDGLGLHVIIEGVHSQANAESTEFDGCSESTSSSSYVAKVTVNGKQIKLLDETTPITIKLPLRLSLYLNRKVVTNHQVTQDVVYLQWPDKRYDIAIGESTAGTLCHQLGD